MDNNPKKRALAEAMHFAKEARAALYKKYKELGIELDLMEAGLTGLLKSEFDESGIVPMSIWKDADGVTYTLTLDKDDTPMPQDWEALQNHITLTGEFDLLHKRVSVTAIRKRWEEGQEVPGVGHVEKFEAKVSVKKPKQKPVKDK